MVTSTGIQEAYNAVAHDLPRYLLAALAMLLVWTGYLAYRRRRDRRVSKAAIAQSGDLLHTVLETAPIAVFWKDRDLRYLGCNQVFADHAGFASPKDVIGKSDFQMPWGNQAEIFRTEDRAVIDSGTATPPYEQPRTTPEGKVVWLRKTKAALRRNNSEIIGVIGVFEDITELKRTALALQASEEVFRKAFYLTPDAMNINRMRDGMYVSVNAGFTKAIGYSERDIVGRTSVELNIWAFPEDRARMVSLLRKDSAVSSFEAWFKTKDGSLIYGSMSAAVVNIDQEPHIVSVTRDFTERRKIQERLRQLTTAVEQSTASVVITDIDARIEYVNPRFTAVTGYSAAEVMGQNPRLLQSKLTPNEIYTELWSKLSTGQPWHGELINRRKDGAIYWEDTQIAPVKDEHGTVTHYIAVKADVTQRKYLEEQVRVMAFHDPLTKLPNRRLLADRLSQTMTATKRSGRYGALLFLDLDNFKPLNDTHGHKVGDLLLLEATERLKNCVREIDTVARFGGDEFVVLLSDLHSDRAESTAQTRIIAEKISAALSLPYVLTIKQGSQTDARLEYRLSASIGAIVFINHEHTQDDLLRYADMAMYQAKAQGRNTIRFHSPVN